MDILEILRQDYQRFPADQTYRIYADGVRFQDPLNQFQGVERYQRMIGLIQTWFLDCRMDLHDIYRTEDTIHTRWTLSWLAPLPWRPAMSISGRSQLELNPAGQIIAHIDYWDCSRLDVLRQLFRLPA